MGTGEKPVPFLLYMEKYMLIDTSLEKGKVYSFAYRSREGVNSHRVALYLGDGFHDFEKEDFRNFQENGMSQVKDVTTDVWVRDSDDVVAARFRKAGCKIYDDGVKMWIVNL
jgi:hypothetical protein